MIVVVARCLPIARHNCAAITGYDDCERSPRRIEKGGWLECIQPSDREKVIRGALILLTSYYPVSSIVRVFFFFFFACPAHRCIGLTLPDSIPSGSITDRSRIFFSRRCFARVSIQRGESHGARRARLDAQRWKNCQRCRIVAARWRKIARQSASSLRATLLSSLSQVCFWQDVLHIMQVGNGKL